MLLPFIIFSIPLLAIFGFFLQSRGVRLAYIWFMVLVISVINSIILIFIEPGSMKPFVLENWFRIGSNAVHLSFSFSAQKWNLVIAAIAILIMYFMTSIVRLESKNDKKRWTLISMLTAAFLLSALADNLWTLIITWTTLDILYLGFRFIISGGENQSQLLKATIIRFIGSGILIWVAAIYSPYGINMPLSKISPQAVIPLFLSGALHSGALPINNISSENSYSNDELVDLAFRVFLFVSSLFMLIYCPNMDLNIIQSGISTIILSIPVFFFSFKWVVEKDDNLSLNYFELTILCISLLHVINGKSESLSIWLVFFLIATLYQIFHTHRSKSLSIIILLLFFLFSGLPFSFFTYGIRGIPFSRFTVNLLPLFTAHFVLLIGLFSKILMDKSDYKKIETWYQAIYAVGLFFPILSIGAIVFRNLGSLVEEVKFWWIGLVVACLFILGSIYTNRKKKHTNLSHNKVIGNLLSLNWLFSAIVFLDTYIQNVVIGFSSLLEGEAGIIWSFVMIILLISVIRLGN